MSKCLTKTGTARLNDNDKKLWSCFTSSNNKINNKALLNLTLSPDTSEVVLLITVTLGVVC